MNPIPVSPEAQAQVLGNKKLVDTAANLFLYMGSETREQATYPDGLESAAVALGGVHAQYYCGLHDSIAFTDPMPATGFEAYALTRVWPDCLPEKIKGAAWFASADQSKPAFCFFLGGLFRHIVGFEKFDSPTIIARYQLGVFRPTMDLIITPGTARLFQSRCDLQGENTTVFKLIPTRLDRTTHPCRPADAIELATKICNDTLQLLAGFATTVNPEAFPWSHHPQLREMLLASRGWLTYYL